MNPAMAVTPANPCESVANKPPIRMMTAHPGVYPGTATRSAVHMKATPAAASAKPIAGCCALRGRSRWLTVRMRFSGALLRMRVLALRRCGRRLGLLVAGTDTARQDQQKAGRGIRAEVVKQATENPRLRPGVRVRIVLVRFQREDHDQHDQEEAAYSCDHVVSFFLRPVAGGCSCTLY